MWSRRVVCGREWSRRYTPGGIKKDPAEAEPVRGGISVRRGAKLSGKVQCPDQMGKSPDKSPDIGTLGTLEI